MRTWPYAHNGALGQPADLGSETPVAHNKVVTDVRAGSQENIARADRS